MRTIEIKNQFTGEKIINLEYDEDGKLITNLICADLTDADMTGVDLTGANLICANLRRANLTRSNLTDALLKGADLTDANLTGADLTSTKGIFSLPVVDDRGWLWFAVVHRDGPMIKAGCRWYTMQEARDHWMSDEYKGPDSVKQTIEFALRECWAWYLGETK